MDFTQKKLPQEVAEQLRKCAIDSVKPYALMVAPTYVYLKHNHKFVSVKGPLDFFTPFELEKMAPYENFYFTEAVDAALNFRAAGARVKALLSAPTPADQLSTPSYESADSVLRIVGPLWGSELAVEPFFASVFTNELCGLLPNEWLADARERGIDQLETALLHAGLVVFLALHLGFADLDFLTELRRRIVFRHFDGTTGLLGGQEIESLWVWAAERVPGGLARLKSEDFSTPLEPLDLILDSRFAARIAARLERVRAELLRADVQSASARSPGGFAHAG